MVMTDENRGEQKYRRFLKKLGLNYKNIMTPRTNTLENMSDAKGEELTIQCVQELYSNYFSVGCCSGERRR